jgi:hypothetical protein
MPKMSPEDLAWYNRIESLLAVDIQTAETILAKHGFTPDQALASVMRASSSGVGHQFRPEAPKELRDPTSECCYALRILLLAKGIRESDPKAVQFGRLWGRAAMGLEFPNIATSMRNWLLGQARGPGGAKTNDLTRTLEQIFHDKPSADRKHVLEYLQSEEAYDKFYSIENQEIFVTAVEIDEQAGTMKYMDRTRKTRKITFASLDRRLRELRPK